jgi:hypothetical protein
MLFRVLAQLKCITGLVLLKQSFRRARDQQHATSKFVNSYDKRDKADEGSPLFKLGQTFGSLVFERSNSFRVRR